MSNAKVRKRRRRRRRMEVRRVLWHIEAFTGVKAGRAVEDGLLAVAAVCTISRRPRP